MLFEDKIHPAVCCLLDEGHLDIAQWMLDKLLDEFPTHAPAHHELALIAHQQEDNLKAGQHFEKAVEHAPFNPKFQKSLGDFYHVILNRPEQAMDNYEKVLELMPDDMDTLLTAAHLNVSLHRFDEATLYYQRALNIDPSNEEACDILARLKAHQGQHQTASASLDEIYYSACDQASQGQIPEAVATFEKVLAIDENHALAHNNLGVLRFESGDIRAARSHYEKAAELEPKNLTFQKNLGDFYYFQCSEHENALKKYVQALTLDPQDTETLISTGHLCMTLNREEDARDFIQRVIEIEPWNNDAAELLDALDRNMSGSEKCLEGTDFYASAIARADVNDTASAIPKLEQLVAGNPTNSLALNDLGVLYYETGDKEKALACYEKAYEIAPNHLNIIKNLADFYLMEQERIEDAMKLYIKVLENSPEDIECLMATAHVCTLMGKPNDAKEFYHRILEIEPWNQDAREALDRLEKGALAVTDGFVIKQAMGSR